MKKIIFISMTVLLFVIAALFAANTKMKEGKWEVSMSMDIKDLPFTPPPFKYTQCITKEDIEKNQNTVPAADKNKDCEVTEYKVKGNTVTWKTKCKDGSQGSGEITYTGDSYSGKMKMEGVDKKGKKQSIDYKIKGKRLGDC